MILSKRAKAILLGVACAAAPLITTATCDPYRGTFYLYRDDDYDDGFFVEEAIYYDDYYYDDCYSFDCY